MSMASHAAGSLPWNQAVPSWIQASASMTENDDMSQNGAASAPGLSPWAQNFLQTQGSVPMTKQWSQPLQQQQFSETQSMLTNGTAMQGPPQGLPYQAMQQHFEPMAQVAQQQQLQGMNPTSQSNASSARNTNKRKIPLWVILVAAAVLCGLVILYIRSLIVAKRRAVKKPKHDQTYSSRPPDTGLPPLHGNHTQDNVASPTEKSIQPGNNTSNEDVVSDDSTETANQKPTSNRTGNTKTPSHDFLMHKSQIELEEFLNDKVDLVQAQLQKYNRPPLPRDDALRVLLTRLAKQGIQIPVAYQHYVTASNGNPSTPSRSVTTPAQSVQYSGQRQQPHRQQTPVRDDEDIPNEAYPADFLKQPTRVFEVPF